MTLAIQDPPPPPVGRRYQVGMLLGRGGMGEVWRAHDRLTGSEVALKRIRPVRLRSRPAAMQETLRLTQEFSLLASLHHPHVIGAIDYGLDRQGWPFFTMRLLDGATTLSQAVAGRERLDRIRLLLQLFDGLAYLHRRGVLHRDLKPSNILVIGDRLHIVDFGLSIARHEAGQAESLAGTLHYLAPELLSGAQPSELSDLYAAGLLSYEVLTGRQAFRTSSRTNLESAIRNQLPEFDDPGLSDGIGPLLRQLLAKDPAQRLHDHGAITGLLAALSGERTPAPRTADGRDGLARAAPLVGREREFRDLLGDLMAAVDGTGRVRLLLGVVGAGKSRLVEELRSVALVQGALFLEGHTPPEGGQPFAPWRQALRPLVIECDLDDRAAAVLRPLVPNIEAIIGRQVPPVPELDPGGTIGRLASVIAAVIRDLGRPVAIAIEDLHWAGAESLDLFAILALTAPELPLLLIGTARSEEAPGLAARIGVEVATALQPLDVPALEELAAATIGQQGRVRDVIDLLTRESEGNPFLAIEVLRSLVDRAGGWDRIDAVALPDRVLVGGMRALAARRLNRLTADDRRIAVCAAVAGRELDLELLRRVEPAVDWSGFLSRASDCGLVENHGGRWTFVHEQLRASVIAAVDAVDRRDLHARIAKVIEAQEPAAVQRAAELAWHWREAEEPEREVRWSEIAAAGAVEAGAWRHAADRFERVVDLHRLHGRRLLTAVDPLATSFRAGDAAFRAGDFPRALGHLTGVLGMDGRSPMSPAPVPRIAGAAVQALIQLLHRLPGGARAWFLSPATHRRTALSARTWELLARMTIYSGDGLGVLVCALRAANLSENAGTPLPFAQGLVGCAAAAAGRWGVAGGYFQRSRRSGDPLALADTLVMEGASLLGAARFDDALARLREARRTAEAVGYRLGAGQALAVEAVVHGYLGDNPRMLALDLEALSCIRHHSHGHQPGFRCGHAKALINLGRFTEARATLETAKGQVAKDDRLSRGLIAASLLLVHLCEGDLAAAQREEARLDEMMEGFTAIPPPCAQLVEAPAELLIARWHLAIQRGDPVGDLPQLAKRRWRALRAWARIYAVGQPFAWWFRGHQAFLLARQSEAWSAWEHGRAEAVRLGMPVYEGMLSLTLGRHGPRAQQRAHRFRARALFLSSHAMWQARQMGDDRDDEGSGSAYQAWLADEGSGTRTAAYNIPTRRTER